MGFSPLKTGVAFLPFSAGIVIAATVASRLMERVDPRWLAGVGTLLAGSALFGFSRLPYDDTLPSLSVHAHYASDILPFVILMSLGMGMTFVPMTLSAVHGVGRRDSGVGSGVLNTMQQVGGALGLATLSTVAVHFTSEKVASLASAADPTQVHKLQPVIGQVAFAEGATHAFLTGAGMIWLGTLVVLLFLDVKHEELATDDAPEGAAI
jgi:hypothetical protein